MCAAGLTALLCVVGWRKLWKQDENLRFVEKMGNGINLGNALDSTNLRQYRPDAGDLEYEEFWGNPAITQQQLAAVKEAGFGTVRIPVTWEDHMDENGMISQVWLDRVQQVVDMALAEDLYVIIDTHHESWLDLRLEQEAEITARLQTLWTQIAERFADYDEKLLFEGMNEPRLRGSEHEWDAGTPEMRGMVNRLNVAFVQTVRNSGGNNQERYLLICPYATNSVTEALEALEVPEGHIIVSVHAYLPYGFCQDTGGTAQWSQGNPQDTAEIEAAFADMNRLFVENQIPVLLTEFGCIDKNNLDQRMEWTRFMVQTASDNGVQCIWWDNGSEFRLLDRTQGEWIYPELTEVLTQ